MQVLDKRII